VTSPSNEFLLVREASFSILWADALGSSIYHIGFQMAGFYQNQEMDVLSAGDVHPRQELAMDRMEEEGRYASADGVVRCIWKSRDYEWGEPGGVGGRHRHQSIDRASTTTFGETAAHSPPT